MMDGLDTSMTVDDFCHKGLEPPVVIEAPVAIEAPVIVAADNVRILHRPEMVESGLVLTANPRDHDLRFTLQVGATPDLPGLAAKIAATGVFKFGVASYKGLTVLVFPDGSLTLPGRSESLLADFRAIMQITDVEYVLSLRTIDPFTCSPVEGVQVGHVWPKPVFSAKRDFPQWNSRYSTAADVLFVRGLVRPKPPTLRLIARDELVPRKRNNVVTLHSQGYTLFEWLVRLITGEDATGEEMEVFGWAVGEVKNLKPQHVPSWWYTAYMKNRGHWV